MAASPANPRPEHGVAWRAIQSSWRAVWLVRSRELHLNLGYWLILLGYNLPKRRFENPFYTLYAVIFFALWGFMVLLLLANYAGQALLRMTFFGDPARAALLAGALAWLVLLLAGMQRAARRSPAVFEDSDAQWLVISPIDRRVVGLVWFAEACLWRAFWIWAAVIVLGYAHLEATTPVELAAADLPRYLLAGLRMLSVGIPLHLAADGLVWAAGVWRLQGSRDRSGPRYLAPLMGLLLLAGWSLGGPAAVEILLPLTYAIRAGLDQAPLSLGLLAAWLLAAGSMLLLLRFLPRFSLARAAQETRSQAAMRAAVQAQDQAAYQELDQRRRLGTGQGAARFLFRRGAGVIVSRNLVQSKRTLQPIGLLAWLGLVSLPLVAAFSADWGAQAWAALGWVLLIGYQVEGALRKALSRWWLLRSLPLRAEAMVLAELALPLAGAWLALAVGLLAAVLLVSLVFNTMQFAGPLSAVIAPSAWVVALAWPAVPGVALAAAIDVLRQAKSGQVLAGFTPAFSLVGLLLAMLAVALPAGLYWLGVSAWSMQPPLAIGMMLALSLGVDYQLWQMAGDYLRSIK